MMLNTSMGANVRLWSQKLIIGLLFMFLIGPASADPPPDPPEDIILPSVFCFRVTDIDQVVGDPEGDRFA